MPDEARWRVGDLPFLWNPLPTPNNPAGLPNHLPFTIGVDRETGALIQEPMPLVSQALSRAYLLGSMITGQMDETGIGRRYADDFLAFMRGPNGIPTFDGKRVLEVGCGNGYLLHRLAGLGARVIGLEPGEHGQDRYAVPVIRDFFPSLQVRGTFDVIVMFGVLEHVEKPLQFMEQVFEQLDPDGVIMIGVPDCAPYLEAGDLSCFIHEHWTYFDEDSLAKTLRQAGGSSIYVGPSGYGGLLYARVSRGHDRKPGSAEGVELALNRLRIFRARAERAISAVADYLRVDTSQRETAGIYVPGRIINTLFASGVSSGNLRFFDDNPRLTGTFFPGVPVPVETRADLVARPTERVLIMSRSFGESIAQELRPRLPATTAISTWHDIFE